MYCCLTKISACAGVVSSNVVQIFSSQHHVVRWWKGMCGKRSRVMGCNVMWAAMVDLKRNAFMWYEANATWSVRFMNKRMHREVLWSGLWYSRKSMNAWSRRAKNRENVWYEKNSINVFQQRRAKKHGLSSFSNHINLRESACACVCVCVCCWNICPTWTHDGTLRASVIRTHVVCVCVCVCVYICVCMYVYIYIYIYIYIYTHTHTHTHMSTWWYLTSPRNMRVCYVCVHMWLGCTFYLRAVDFWVSLRVISTFLLLSKPLQVLSAVLRQLPRMWHCYLTKLCCPHSLPNPASSVACRI